MVLAKNYETASTFVKVIQRKLLASLFPDTVYIRPTWRTVWLRQLYIMDGHLIFHEETKTRCKTRKLKTEIRQWAFFPGWDQDDMLWCCGSPRPWPSCMVKTIKHHKYGSSELASCSGAGQPITDCSKKKNCKDATEPRCLHRQSIGLPNSGNSFSLSHQLNRMHASHFVINVTCHLSCHPRSADHV